REATDATTSALEYDSGVLTAKQAVKKLSEQMRTIAESGELPGLSTGMDPIDTVTGGMRPGELWVVAAETSGGKSVWLLQTAVSAIQMGKRVLIISLEMQASLVVSRMACNLRAVPLGTFTHPRQAGARWLQVASDCLKGLAEAPLSIHDKGGVTFDQIAGIARCEAVRHGKLDLLIVDYLQLVDGSRRRRDETREQEMAGISRGLKSLAKALDCPVATASQMNEQGKMRESRAIGFDADVVLVIEEDGIRGAKVRNAERGQLFPLKLNGSLQRFERVYVAPQQTEFRTR
ncbi:MAG: putative replicative helicase, partial [Akkermansiaceae bacterium]|nr:putative replicative helicase [Akkermansiaceae bacterium]